MTQARVEERSAIMEASSERRSEESSIGADPVMGVTMLFHPILVIAVILSYPSLCGGGQYITDLLVYLLSLPTPEVCCISNKP
jgi:hypothetical protein